MKENTKETMKVSDLSKELNVQSKEVLEFLREKGFDYGSAAKKISEEEIAMVRARFSGADNTKSEKAEKKPAAEKTVAKQEKEEPAGKTEKAVKTGKTEEAGKEEKKETAGNENGVKPEEKTSGSKPAVNAPAAAPVPARQGNVPPQNAEPPKKKKTIIMVGKNIPQKPAAPNSQRPQGQRPMQQNPAMQGKRPVNQGIGGNRPLIKPTTPPSAAPEIHFVPENNQGRNTDSKKQNPEKVNTAAATAPEKKVAPAGNTQNANTAPAANPAVNPAPAAKEQGNASVPDSAKKNPNPGNAPQKPFAGQKSAEGFQTRPVSNGDRNGRGPVRGDDRNGNRPQGGFNQRSGDNRPQGGRPQGGFNGRPGQNPFKKDEGDGDKKFMRKPQGGKIFTADAPSVDNRKNDNKRRNNDKDKNKKSGRDFMYEEDGIKGGKGKQSKVGAFIKPEKKPVVEEEEIKVITVPEEISIKDLADKMKLQANVIIKELFMKGEMVTLNDVVPFEKAEEIAMEHDILCEAEVKVNVIEELLKEDEEDPALLTDRPPVICVMGHVDHGKTSLLDAIRKTHVIQGEAGGITQHIGAYMVNVTDPETGNDRKITFLDTPGHEAFTAMRMRGANSTDIAILVVAADDGVMPQTKEAINHAKAAGVPIIVAVNKVDKIGYDFKDKSKTMDSYPGIAKLIRELADEHSLVWEEWGGETIFAPISAKQGQGINELLEMILLSADMLELKANAKRKARGLVIEAELDKGRGPVATVLVQKGTLHVGDFISAGEAHGKVRAMIDDKGRRLKEATPSTPVEILGLNGVPGAGEIFIAHASDKEAKNFADTFIAQNKVKKISDTKKKMNLDDLYSQIQAGNLKELNLIIKADVQGSVEAVKESLEKLSNEEVVVKVIHGGVGAINESDVVLASAAKAIIIGFNVRLDNMAKDTVEREGVDVRLYDVIYKAIEDVESAMKGMLEPIFEEKIIGHAEVRQIFKASAIGNIAGSFVLDGIFERGCLIRITRGGEQIYEGKLASLKRFKDDVKEVKAGFECGLVFENFGAMEELDIVEAYKMVEVPRS